MAEQDELVAMEVAISSSIYLVPGGHSESVDIEDMLINSSGVIWSIDFLFFTLQKKASTWWVFVHKNLHIDMKLFTFQEL